MGVAAGFAPVSIGTETIGSLLMPADRAALYTIKPTLGLISQRGIVPISNLCDSAGPMAKSSRDVGQLLDVLMDHNKTIIPEGGYLSVMSGLWGNIRVGVLEPEAWYHSEQIVKPGKSATEQMVSVNRNAYAIAPLVLTRKLDTGDQSRLREAREIGEEHASRSFDLHVGSN